MGNDLLSTLLAHATQSPGERALSDEVSSTTYGELAERVERAAAGLGSLGIRQGDRVALALGNCAAFVWTALACLWVGAAFVPIDVDSPPARKAQLLDDCEPVVVVASQPSTAGTSGAPVPEAPACAWAKGRLVVAPSDLLRTDRPAPEPRLDGHRAAYIIYTSGTTGAPKGVTVPEEAFAWSVHQTVQTMGLGRSARALAVSSFHFDGSYGLVFPTLAAGGSLVVPRREEVLFLRSFFQLVVEEEITITSFSPSYLRLLVSSRHLPKLAKSHLTTLMLGGEAPSAPDIARLWEILPGLRVFNRYGPTETTIAVTTYQVAPEDVASGKIPLGHPHDGTEFYLTAETGELIGSNEGPGELHIGGRQLMTGYWGDEELTNTVVRQDLVPGMTVYRTGDLVSRDRQGLYYYHGRLDDVVKRNGIRISLSEIAAALASAQGVQGAVCLLTDLQGAPAVTAFVQGDRSLQPKAALDVARQRLPANALPDEVVMVSSMPLTSQGKVDRRGLLASSGRRAWTGP